MLKVELTLNTMAKFMANPVIGDEEDTSLETPPEENDSSEETEDKEEPVEKDQSPAGEDKPEVIPYHKDKRWIEMYDKAKRFDDLEQETLTLKEKLEKLEQMKSDDNLKVPESFKRLFGDDPDVYRLWKAEQDERERTLRADILKEMDARKEEEERAFEKETDEWKEYFDSEIQALKDDGFQFDEEKLKKFVLDNEITDSRNVYDLKKGLLKMQSQTKANPARKAIASMTGEGGKTAEPPKKDFATSEDFIGPNRPW